MPKLLWDQLGKKKYETGVSKVALYVHNGTAYTNGVAWNGVTKIDESPSGAEPSKLYANNGVYATLISNEELGATIEAYTYPDEFGKCNGEAELVSTVKGVTVGQQTRSMFGLVYRTEIGNDSNPNSGYKLHILYNATAAPSSRSNSTINESPEAVTLSWTLTTVPMHIEGFTKPAAKITIDSTVVPAAKLKAIEDKLYGTESGQPTLLLPSEIMAILKAAG